MKVYSIGHSNRSFSDFLSILLNYEINHLVDVRHYPVSNRFPHFNREAFEDSFSNSPEGLKYSFLGKDLGGKRNIDYSKYMKSDSFISGMKELFKIAKYENTCFMCAEKNYLHCHRKFIADKFIQLNWQVLHLVEKNRAISHPISLF